MIKHEKKVITDLNDLQEEMKKWAADPDNGSDANWFLKVADVAKKVSDFITKEQYKQADDLIKKLEECGKQMIYNRVGLILDYHLGKRQYRHRYFDSHPDVHKNGKINQRVNDEIIYFG